jgi:uncharacterized repeat protein (TIGR01451 family)
VGLKPNKLILTLCALGLSSAVAMAQNENTDDFSVTSYFLQGAVSTLELSIDDRKSFSILSPPDFNYDSGSGIIDFNILGPLTCFGAVDGPTNPALFLTLEDANEDFVVFDLGLENFLQYRLASNEIAISVPQSAACFYQTEAGFGVDGIAPTEDQIDNDNIFADQFLASSRLNLEYVNLPAFVRPGELINYSIEISNAGNLSATAVGFQELYPGNPAFYDANFDVGFYSCQAFGGANCADVSVGSSGPSIRGQNISIPPDGLIRLNVTRRVNAASPIGQTLDLYAGTVDRTSSGLGNWDSETATMTVIGEGQTIAATFENKSPPVADGVDQALIRVTALDEFKNPTPDVSVQVSDPDGLNFISSSGVTGADGSFVFLARTIGAEAAGGYLPTFLAPDIGASGVSTEVSVEFVAGTPTSFSAFTVTDNRTADGQDAGVIEVSVFDAFSNPVENAEVTVQDDDGLDFAAISVSTDEFGVAAFQMTTTTSGSYTPVFAQSSIGNSTSSDITFEAGSPSSLAFLVQPSDVTAGQAISPAVVLEVIDQFGNRVVTDNSSTVTTQLRQNGVGQAFFQDVTAVEGIVTLSDLIIQNSGTGYDLRVFSDYPTVTSGTFEVFPIPQD